MSMRNYLKFILFAPIVMIFVSIIGAPNAFAENCYVYDPDDSGVNIRLSPNGKLINRLSNGREVVIEEIGHDSQGRPWARVAGSYQGRWRHWGWAYMDLVRCR